MAYVWRGFEDFFTLFVLAATRGTVMGDGCGCLRLLKKSFLSTNGLAVPVPSGSRSKKASKGFVSDLFSEFDF